MLARALTFSLLGVDGVPVTVEADIHSGLPAFTIVGLPDVAVQESRERVRAALLNSGFDFPLRRITVNLAPADLRKVGPGFDLGLAAAVLVASGQVQSDRLASCALCGELGLDGSVRGVRGAIVMAQAARAAGCEVLVIPRANAAEAALVDGLDIAPIETLLELAQFLGGELPPSVPAIDTGVLLASPPQRRHRLPPAARPPRPAARARGRGCGRPQPADDRARRAPASRWRRAACRRSCRRSRSTRRWR